MKQELKFTSQTPVEWLAFCVLSHSVASDSLATPWTVACQAPLSMGFPRQEYWTGLPSPSPEDFPHLGIKLTSPALAGGFLTTEPPGKLIINCVYIMSNIMEKLYTVSKNKTRS